MDILFVDVSDLLAPSANQEEKLKFYKWRATTTKLVTARHHIDPTSDPSSHRQGLALKVPISKDRMVLLLKNILPIVNPLLTSGLEQKYKDEFETILRLAIELDAFMSEQWAVLFAAPSPSEAIALRDAATKPFRIASLDRYGFPFHNSTMQPAYDGIYMQADEAVGLVVAPALIRAGTVDGVDFHRMEVLVNARVLPCGFTARNLKPKNAKDHSVRGRLLGFRGGQATQKENSTW